ncbi:hypothetical protein HCJ95_09645 [Streptomyces thermoviolaceus subsp. thermoviolaceus]|uniref:DUF8175 domain-containing protein n=2 Tax=Streptomyces thermoviolaceus TaxID=1952 RepID=A0ABX0YTV6_STRTL|nr:hypothetical protein [Streptomyces thermoviolaceus subsp. thermoviolaceus]
MFTRTDDGGGETRFWQRGRLLSAGFLAAALGISLVSFLTGGHDEEQRPAALTALGPLAQGPDKATGRPPGCHTDDASDALPKRAPSDVTWRMVGGTRVPTSASAGPTRAAGPVLWCFAHTPMGAVMAAHVIPAQMTGPAWREVVDEQVVAGFGRNLFVSQRSSLDDAELESQPTGSYAGFTLEDYDKDSADVGILVKNAQGGLLSSTIRLRWSGGDWKVVPGSDGGLHSQVSAADGTDGYIQWGV